MKKFVLTFAAAMFLVPPLADAQAPAQPPPSSTTTTKTTTTATTTSATTRQTTLKPTYEVGLGYQYLRTGQFCAAYDDSTCSDDDPKSFPFGAVLEGVRNFGGLGIVGEVGWSRDDKDNDDPFGDRLTTDIVHFGAGVRYTGRYGRFWPYGQVIGGGAHNRYDGIVGGQPFRDTRTRPMAQAGGGITFVTGDGWGIFIDAAYRRMFLDEEEDFISGRNDVRGVFGFRLILD